MANTYHIEVTRGGVNVERADVEATTPAYAIKRLLDGGHGAGYKFASVKPGRQLKLAKGEVVVVRCTRI